MSYMKQPCKHCPFRRDVKPFLTPERGEELAYHTCNPYNYFPCHKTTGGVNDPEDYDDDIDFEQVIPELEFKECAGFMSMQHFMTGSRLPKGFEASELVYTDTWEMIDAYEEQEERKNK